MGAFVFWILCIILVCLIGLQAYLSERDSRKREERTRIKTIQDEIIQDLKDFEERAEWQGEDFYNSLMEVARAMEKLSSEEVKKVLKPYDAYNRKAIGNKWSRKLFTRIVINKNLEPRFMASPHSLDKKRLDIQLEAALDVNGVKALAEKCRKIKMDVDIENFRKNKVKEFIDGN